MCHSEPFDITQGKLCRGIKKISLHGVYPEQGRRSRDDSTIYNYVNTDLCEEQPTLFL